MLSKFKSATAKFEKNRRKVLKELKDGEITNAEYKAWVQSHSFSLKWYKGMMDNLADRAVEADKQSVARIVNAMPEVYAEGKNEATYEIERDFRVDTNYTLLNADMVRNGIEGDYMIPRLDITEDERWNKRRIASAITQGLLQGDSTDGIARRLRNTVNMDRKASIRNARTWLGYVQNKAHESAYDRLREQGVDVRDCWLSAGDMRVRHSHRALDGTFKGEDGKFANGLRFPRDMEAGIPNEVYNCRCVLKGRVFGIPFDMSHRVMNIGDMTYEEWKNGKDGAKVGELVNGKDLLHTYTPKSSDINDIMHEIVKKQGFDGLPRVVDDDEFNSYVEESNFIAQRIYNAEKQETLKEYQRELYFGEWYIDCHGGSALGKGMYCAYANGNKVTDAIRQEMETYRRGMSHSIIETMTLDKSARTITIEELNGLKNEFNEWLWDEYGKRREIDKDGATKWADKVDKISRDNGTFAAALGYDAIIDKGLTNYCVVLNRTKVIFKRGKK